ALVASLENGGHIELPQWARAQEIAELMRRNLHELYYQVNTQQEQNCLEDVLIDYLKTLGGKSVTIRDIRRLSPADLRNQSSEVIRHEMENLMRSGIVERKRLEGSRAEWYTLASYA